MPYFTVPPSLPPFLPGRRDVSSCWTSQQWPGDRRSQVCIHTTTTTAQPGGHSRRYSTGVCSSMCVCVCTVCVGLCACTLYGSVWGVCLVAGECWRHESHLSKHTWTKGCLDNLDKWNNTIIICIQNKLQMHSRILQIVLFWGLDKWSLNKWLPTVIILTVVYYKQS